MVPDILVILLKTTTFRLTGPLLEAGIEDMASLMLDWMTLCWSWVLVLVVVVVSVKGMPAIM